MEVTTQKSVSFVVPVWSMFLCTTNIADFTHQSLAFRSLVISLISCACPNLPASRFPSQNSWLKHPSGGTVTRLLLIAGAMSIHRLFAAKGTGDELTHVPLTEVFNRKLAWLPKEWNAFSEIVEECSELYTWGSLISHKRKPDDCDRTRSISMISEPQVCFLLGTGQLVRPVPPKSPNLTLAC